MNKYALEYIGELKNILERFRFKEFNFLLAAIIEAYKKDRQIFIFGNGGSAATALHFACDINKGLAIGLKKRFKVFCLNESISTITAYANDMHFEDIFVEQLKNFLKKHDLVIGLSSSGNSLNVLKAISYANRNGAITFGITGFRGGKLKKLARHSLVVNSDDMQQIEDVHLILLHIIMQILRSKIVKMSRV